jgi:hypothetical protein
MSDRRNTNKSTSLTVGQARELVGRGRKLYFDGVESLTAEVARVLAGNECRLSLNRLSCLTKEGSTMGKFTGGLRYSALVRDAHHHVCPHAFPDSRFGKQVSQEASVGEP